MIKYVYTRLSESSTWRGLAALVTAAGIGISPDQIAAISALGLAVIGAIGTFFPDTVK
jgi:sulfur transfer protein SufE